MKLSILLPVYNECSTILKIIELIKKVPIEKEIILVDDCSTDGTRQIIQENREKLGHNIRVFCHDKNAGKGAAVQTALAAATGHYCIIQDADLEYNPADYVALLKFAVEGNHDVVYGSRFLSTRHSTSLPHYMVNKFLTMLTNILYGTNISDMETCYKLIRTTVFKEIGIRSRRFELEPEITVKLVKRGCYIHEVPISYRGRSYHEGKKITWRDGIVAVWTLMKYKFL